MVLKTAARLASLLRQVVWPRPFPGIGRYLYRLLVLLLFLPAFLLLQLFNWTGLLLDEVLFRGYRRIAVREPWFVLGVPRSGTTFMHRLLASDPASTTFSTWECLFAPSITQRYLFRGIGAVDRRIGRPLARSIAWLERKALAWIEDVHPMSLDAPEEDYLTFLPLLCCFVLIVPFPEADWVWSMGTFDRDLDDAERARLLRWYRRCLQKHLYVHGEHKTLLSKNASFAGMAGSLVEAFPDARLVICERDALQVIASQFNSLESGRRLFGYAPHDDHFRGRLLDCLAFYYENLERVHAALPDDRAVQVSLWELSRDTRRIVETINARFGRVLAPQTNAVLAEYENRVSPVTPARVPDLQRWGIDAGDIGRRFSAWRHEEEVRL